MLIYNVTIQPTWSIHDEWFVWMKNEHIPAMLQTGCFSKHQWVKLLEVDETDGPTYSIQYYARTKEDYDRYIEAFANEMRKSGIDLWKGNFIAFRSIMEVVH